MIGYPFKGPSLEGAGAPACCARIHWWHKRVQTHGCSQSAAHLLANGHLRQQDIWVSIKASMAQIVLRCKPTLSLLTLYFGWQGKGSRQGRGTGSAPYREGRFRAAAAWGPECSRSAPWCMLRTGQSPAVLMLQAPIATCDSCCMAAQAGPHTSHQVRTSFSRPPSRRSRSPRTCSCSH